ncbi:hypothetical protein A2U01_0016532 [Trifolium medium]|uniref:Uncharacterized protein n=1 Tax=Trifolium medium TaxID=97028 RepID=A0A392N7K3_9FABA|nr:hypothetical protein [Trifolium medium]
MLGQLSQTLGPNSEVDSVINSVSNPLVVLDIVCSEVTPDNDINHYSCISQPFLASAKQSKALVLCFNDDDIIGSLQCLLSKLFPPYFNAPNCNYGTLRHCPI